MKLEDWALVGFLVLYALCMSDAQANEPETNDMRYMTEAIYFESRGEPDICKLFVAKTIKTRISKNLQISGSPRDSK